MAVQAGGGESVIEKYEMIARRYLELSGQDPEEITLVPCPDGIDGCLVAHYGYKWRAYVDMARDAERWKKALDIGNQK